MSTLLVQNLARGSHRSAYLTSLWIWSLVPSAEPTTIVTKANMLTWSLKKTEKKKKEEEEVMYDNIIRLAVKV